MRTLPVFLSMLLLAGAGALVYPVTVAAVGVVSEQPENLDELPLEVAMTFREELEGVTVDEVERILYEGITVLYQAERREEDQIRTLYVYPSGEVAADRTHEAEAVIDRQY